jgi:thioesterase domain-containing protein
MTVELVNRVERELDVRVPMSALLQGPSLRELGQAVLKLLAPVLERQGAEAATTAAAPLAARATGDADLVVPLSAGDGPPLIAFHPVGGDLGVYAPLVKLLPAGVPVHAVESRLMRGAEREFESLDAMVAAYAAAVRATGAGPYRLFGFSLGGYLAARVAEALEREGETVALVGVVEWDARPRTRLEDQRAALLGLAVATYRFLAEDLGALRPLSETERRTELAPLVRAVVGARRPNTEVFVDWAVERDLITREALRDWVRRYLVGFGQHCAMLAGAVPLPSFRAPLVVWRAAGGFGSPVASWHHAGAAEHVVAGDHFAFFRPPAVGTLATQLAALLRRTPTAGDDGGRGP